MAEEHTPHNLTCTVEGFPEPVTVWYRDDEVVELPKTLTRLDAGHYLITASNNQSNVSATVEIIVHCKSFRHTSSESDYIRIFYSFLS